MNEVALENIWGVTAGVAGAVIRLVVRHDLKILPAFFVIVCGCFFGLFVAPYVNEFMPNSSRRSLIFVAVTLGFVGLTVGEAVLRFIDKNGDGLLSSLSERWFPPKGDKENPENQENPGPGGEEEDAPPPLPEVEEEP